MGIDLNARFSATGTRFRVFPQAPVLDSVEEPETIWLSQRTGFVGTGPADRDMIVRDAIGKSEPYDDHRLPPYRGPMHLPARPDRQGHFDYLPVNSRQFLQAHMYAVIRRVLDVWELYFEAPLRWHFSKVYRRLELIPEVDWDNAQSGFGFIETGVRRGDTGDPRYYCLNFDVLAHEIGHSIVYGRIGWPTPATMTPEYLGFQEAAADMTALIAVLHFDSVVDRLLGETAGNLYALNELNRIAELSESDQIRVASNDRRMSHYAQGWQKEHHLSLPMTGALFDILVGIFHALLVERGLIDRQLAELAYASVLPNTDVERVQTRFDKRFFGNERAFRTALLDARDYVGSLFARALARQSAHHFRYVDFAHAVLDEELRLSAGHFQDLVFDAFEWREIGQIEAGPRLGEEPMDGTVSCR